MADRSLKHQSYAKPTVEELEDELTRVNTGIRFRRTLFSTIYALLIVAAVSVLIATLLFPVLRVYGSSMSPTVNEGDVVLTLKTSHFECGDVVALWYGNKMLIKRVIACSGSWVNIDAEGNVYVDGKALDEPYVTEKALGNCTITLPYQVPDGKLFVLGDHRSISQDSRNADVGCVETDKIAGKLFFCVWPLQKIGEID